MCYLAQNTTLQGGKYRIERVLGQGGFGITYLATQVSSNRKVAIKELFIGGKGQAINKRRGNRVVVTNSANRFFFLQQKEKFIKEAKRLEILDHPNIIKVHEYFEENSTVYYVMDYIDGESLRTKLNREGLIPESIVFEYIKQLLPALEVAHKKSIWHLDIKPENIMVDKNNHVYLIDFGASKHIEQFGTLTTSLALAYTRGYCPPELADLTYENQNDLEQAIKEIGPWTDIYALGATLYNLLTDNIPPSSNRLYKDGLDAFSFPSTVSSSTKDMIVWMMKPNREDRPKNIKEIEVQYKLCLHKTVSKKVTKDTTKSKRNRRDSGSEETVVEACEIINVDSLRKKYNVDPYKNISRYRQTLLQAAIKGDFASQFEVGKWFETHYGGATDLSNAYKALAPVWYKKAASQNHAEAQYALGHCYEVGFGVIESDNIAIKWYRKAANNGCTQAQNRLAKCYLKFELGRARDVHEAIKWLSEAGESADPELLFAVGECYENGILVPCDKKEALNWYRRAYWKGFSSAGRKISEIKSKLIGKGRPYNGTPEYYFIEGDNKSYTRQEIESLQLFKGTKLRKMHDNTWHPMEYYGFVGKKKGIMDIINDFFS